MVITDWNLNDISCRIVEETGLPMFLHNRRSTKDFYRILKENRHRWKKGVVHSFSDTLEDMELLLSLDGIYIGINGCSLKTEENLKMVKAVPSNRLMIETDAPWCGIKRTHASHQYVKTQFEQTNHKKHSMDKCIKGRCEPCHIVQVLEVIAAIKGEDIDTLADIIYQNTIDVFFPNESDRTRSDHKKSLKEETPKEETPTAGNVSTDIPSSLRLDTIERTEVNEWKCWLVRQQELAV